MPAEATAVCGSCRQYLKDPKVRLFAMFTGVVPEDFLSHEPWQFLLKAMLCTRLLMDVNWRLLVKAWPTERGAPLPVPAVMDLLANLYNAENPTQLPVRSPLAYYWSAALLTDLQPLCAEFAPVRRTRLLLCPALALAPQLGYCDAMHPVSRVEAQEALLCGGCPRDSSPRGGR